MKSPLEKAAPWLLLLATVLFAFIAQISALVKKWKPAPEGGDERHIGNPIRMSRLPQRRAEAAPLMGEHTEAVLGEVLGLTADEVAENTTFEIDGLADAPTTATPTAEQLRIIREVLDPKGVRNREVKS